MTMETCPASISSIGQWVYYTVPGFKNIYVCTCIFAPITFSHPLLRFASWVPSLMWAQGHFADCPNNCLRGNILGGAAPFFSDERIFPDGLAYKLADCTMADNHVACEIEYFNVHVDVCIDMCIMEIACSPALQLISCIWSWHFVDNINWIHDIWVSPLVHHMHGPIHFDKTMTWHIIYYNIILIDQYVCITLLHGPSHFKPPLVLPRSETYIVKWWMAHYGAPSAKPQKGWTNNKNFIDLDLGKFNRSILDGRPKIQPVKKTISKSSGKVSYSGTSDLKKTQPWPHLLMNLTFVIIDAC